VVQQLAGGTRHSFSTAAEQQSSCSCSVIDNSVSLTVCCVLVLRVTCYRVLRGCYVLLVIVTVLTVTKFQGIGSTKIGRRPKIAKPSGCRGSSCKRNKKWWCCAITNGKVNIYLPSQHNTSHDNVKANRYENQRGSIANINADGTFTYMPAPDGECTVHVPVHVCSTITVLGTHVYRYIR
jgi:hypothetical protein